MGANQGHVTLAHSIVTDRVHGAVSLEKFSLEVVRQVPARKGIYWIRFGDDGRIQYPATSSSILYVGKAASVRGRLLAHCEVGHPRGNRWVHEYIRQGHDLYFAYKLLQEDAFKTLAESTLINDFVEELGMRPICNSQTPRVEC